jgi:hypothetical protein
MILTGVFCREKLGGDNESASYDENDCSPFFSDFCPAACNGGVDLFYFSSPGMPGR